MLGYYGYYLIHFVKYIKKYIKIFLLQAFTINPLNIYNWFIQ